MKKNTLMDSLTKAAGKKKLTIEEKISDKTKKPKAQNNYIPASRIGKKAVTGFFEPEVIKLLKMLAIEHESSNQELIREAINDLFVKYDKKPIA